MKLLARETTMRCGPGETSVDGSARFATLDARRCVIAHPPTPSGHHSFRLALLGLSIMLVLTLGCARIAPTPTVSQSTRGSRQSVIDQIVDASVKVVLERDARRVTSASGIVIASRPADQDTEAVSYVLTAAHALAGGEGATVYVGFCGSNAARGKFAATVVSKGKPDTLDLALLRVPGIAVPPVALPEDDRVRLGNQILVVGFPEGQRVGISGGIVSQLPLSEMQNGIPADREDQRIVIDAAAPRGVSGGGVFDAETGRLLGIVQGHQTFSIGVKDQAQSYSLKFPVPGSTFVVPMTQVRPFLTSPDVLRESPDLLPTPAQASHVPSK